ncbi:class I SAM-dependent methyltransferase [Flavobacteriaceae bacterium]|nr:class I SAM-dependent methyltransferase [Flavobacteriaceae bacterium]
MNYSKYFEYSKKCNVCDSDSYTTISKRDKFGCYYPLKYCLKCHNIFSLLILKQEKLNYYYDGIANKIKIDKDPIILFQNRIKPNNYAFDRFNFITSNLKKEIKSETLICEIGCSDGANLFPFHVKGYKTIGFDFNSKRIDIGNGNNLNLHKVNSTKTVFTHISKEIKPKLIYLSHLIEHILDLYEFFKNLIKSISINDLLFIETPCIDYIIDLDKKPSRLYPRDKNFINNLQLEHTHFFQEDQLNNILKIFGFKKIFSNHIYRGLFILENKDFPDKDSFNKKIIELKSESIIPKINLLESHYKIETNYIKYIIKHIF